MRIAIKESDGRGFTLRIPTRLLFNYAAAMVAPPLMKKYGFPLTRRQSVSLVRTLNHVRHKNRGWKFLEFESHDGQRVEITL